jgi:hypothetical protein
MAFSSHTPSVASNNSALLADLAMPSPLQQQQQHQQQQPPVQQQQQKFDMAGAWRDGATTKSQKADDFANFADFDAVHFESPPSSKNVVCILLRTV